MQEEQLCEPFLCLEDVLFLSDPDALTQSSSVKQFFTPSGDVVFSFVSLCPTGLWQSVQPAGHPAHHRHELQAAPRSLDVCKVSTQ